MLENRLGMTAVRFVVTRRPRRRACDIMMAVCLKRPCSARRNRSFNRDAEGAAERHASPIDGVLPAGPDAERVPPGIARDLPGIRGRANSPQRPRAHEV